MLIRIIRIVVLGAAILRSLLDEKPSEAVTVVFNPVELNPRIERILGYLGFTASQSLRTSGEWFGEEDTEFATHVGQPVARLINDLEYRHIWLRNRIPFSPNEQPLRST